MQTGRQTRRKSYAETSSFQPMKGLKDQQFESESTNEETKSLSPDKPLGKKPQNPKNKKNTGQAVQENVPTEPSSSEYPSEVQKKQENKGNGSREESTKVASFQKKERVSPLSTMADDVSDETKRQIEMLFEIAQSSASKGDFHQAINIYNKIVKLNEKSTAAWIAIGHCHAMLGDNYGALSSYQKALSITPDSQKDEQLWYGIGLLYQKNEDWKGAEHAFRTALSLNPGPPIKGEILYHLGMIMKAKGNPKECAKMLMNSILIGSFTIDKMVEVLCTVGQAQEEADELNEAVKTYKHALTLDENNLKALQCAGWLSFQLERTNEALDYLTKASLIDEDDVNIIYMKGRCYLKAKQYNKAYDCFHKCLTKDQKNSMFWCSLGILFAEMNQVKSSHECFRNALNFDPANAENHFNMGCLYELCFQFSDALAMHDKAIELDQNFQLAHTRRLGILAKSENPDRKLEVQFKHHKFTPKISKSSPKDKPAFLFPKIGHNEQPTTEIKRNNYNILTNNENEPINAKDFELLTQLQNFNKTQNFKQPKTQPKQKDLQQLLSGLQDISTLQTLFSQGQNNRENPLLLSLENQLLGLSGNNLNLNSSQNEFSNIFSANSSIFGSDLSNLAATLLQQETNLNPKKTKQQSVNKDFNFESIPTLKDYNNYIINAKSQTKLSPERYRFEDPKVPLNEKRSKDDSILLDPLQNQYNVSEGFKASKNITQPIVLKHDLQSIKSKDTEGLSSGVKPQAKSAFKLTHKLQNRDEFDPAPQKKVKMDSTMSSGSGSSPGEKDMSAKKASSLVLTSLVKN